jgi:hypothetical protein
MKVYTFGIEIWDIELWLLNLSIRIMNSYMGIACLSASWVMIYLV